MDYAIAHWANHTECAARTLGDEQASGQTKVAESIKTFTESIEIFLDTHWTGSEPPVAIPQTTFELLQRLQSHTHFQKLSQAITVAKRQARVYGRLSTGSEVLDIIQVLLRIRSCLEHLVSSISDDGTSTQDQIRKFYGKNFFKCPKINCVYFYTGFSSKDQRDGHIQKHERSFFCTFEGCPMSILGCVTEKELKKHLDENHEEIPEQTHDEFPLEPKTPEAENPKPEHLESQTHGSESDETPPDERPKTKKLKSEPLKTPCPHCFKIFTRAYTLRAHIRTHTGERPFICGTCGTAFARSNDYLRHLRTHTDKKEVVCRGNLKDGTPWGCGREFARVDGLKKHHRTNLGQECIRRYLEEEQAETSK
jgi:uncharacterized Zn-finger protein